MLSARLVQLGITNFPTDGIRRFESLSGKISETEATKQRIEEELVDMKNRIPKSHEQGKMTTIEVLLAKESEWHGWRSTVVALNDELRRLEGFKQRLLDRLGVRGEEVETLLFEADVSIRKEEEMNELIAEINELNNQIRFVKNQIPTLENELMEEKTKLDGMDAPTEKEIEGAREWPEIRQQLAEARAYVSFSKSGSRLATPEYYRLLCF